MTKFVDRSGQVHGRLRVLFRASDLVQTNGRRRVQWLCSCECGSNIIVEAGNLATGHTRSCGCLVQDTCSRIGSTNLRHGRTRTREWFAWRGAKDRCFNSNTEHYKNYGARGISMCDRWVNSFEAFFEDMGPCPPGLTLERKDVNGEYGPSNCVWATPKQQVRNRRSTVRVEYAGNEIALADLADRFNLPYRLVYERVVRSGWDVLTALTKSKRSYRV